jgi:low temperature requirement protein LtrA
MSLLVSYLRRQHAIDVAVYQAAHQEAWNRRLHDAMIPAEVASFLWLWTTLLVALQTLLVSKKHNNNNNNNNNKTTEPPLMTILSTATATAWTMGLLSCAVATDRRLGGTVLVLHVLWVQQVCLVGVTRLGTPKSLLAGLVVWTLAWGLQITVGHSWIEGKAPNLFNPNDPVSFLATLTSIVLAWES